MRLLLEKQNSWKFEVTTRSHDTEDCSLNKGQHPERSFDAAVKRSAAGLYRDQDETNSLLSPEVHDPKPEKEIPSISNPRPPQSISLRTYIGRILHIPKFKFSQLPALTTTFKPESCKSYQYQAEPTTFGARLELSVESEKAADTAAELDGKELDGEVEKTPRRLSRTSEVRSRHGTVRRSQRSLRSIRGKLQSKSKAKARMEEQTPWATDVQHDYTQTTPHQVSPVSYTAHDENAISSANSSPYEAAPYSAGNSGPMHGNFYSPGLSPSSTPRYSGSMHWPMFPDSQVAQQQAAAYPIPQQHFAQVAQGPAAYAEQHFPGLQSIDGLYPPLPVTGECSAPPPPVSGIAAPSFSSDDDPNYVYESKPKIWDGFLARRYEGYDAPGTQQDEPSDLDTSFNSPTQSYGTAVSTGCLRTFKGVANQVSRVLKPKRTRPNNPSPVLFCQVLNCHEFFQGKYKKSNLARHVKTVHSSRPPIVCRHQDCDQQFRRSDARKKHEIKQHGLIFVTETREGSSADHAVPEELDGMEIQYDLPH